MTKKELYDILKERFQEVLKEHQLRTTTCLFPVVH